MTAAQAVVRLLHAGDLFIGRNTRRGQGHPENASPAPAFAPAFDPSAVQFDEAPHQRQSNAQIALGAFARRDALGKAVELLAHGFQQLFETADTKKTVVSYLKVVPANRRLARAPR